MGNQLLEEPCGATLGLAGVSQISEVESQNRSGKFVRSMLARLCGLALAATAPQLAHAQAPQIQPGAQPTGVSGGLSAASDNPAATSTASIGEVVVQATRRDTRLTDVPGAVSVVTGTSLEQIGPIMTNSDLINAVPGARFNNLADPLNSEISIRGSGTERATGADSSVGLYANSVYVGFTGLGGRSIAPIDSFDLDHIEVLEGPQGALYGRDAEYGVVNAISAKPVYRDTGYVENVYTFQTENNQLDAVENYKIDDHWATRFSARVISQSNGFEYNPDQNNYYDVTQGYMLRGQVRYRNDKLDVNLMAEQQRLQVPSFWSADQIQPANAATGYPGVATSPLGFSQNSRVIPHNGHDYSGDNVQNVVLSIDYDFHFAKLTSTTSWRRTTTIEDNDTDYLDPAQEAMLQSTCTNPAVLTTCEKGSYPYSQVNYTFNPQQWYEDIHLAGAPVKLLGREFTWLAGFEYFNETDPDNASTLTNPCSTSAAPNPAVGKGFCTGTPTDPQCVFLIAADTACPTVSNVYGANTPYRLDYQSWAPYGSLDYNVGWGVKLSGQVRYAYDDKSAQGATTAAYTGGSVYYLSSESALPNGTSCAPTIVNGVFNFAAGCTPASVPSSNLAFRQGHLTYTGTISYQLPGFFETWHDMLYAKIGTGYRVGGFNLSHSAPLVPYCYTSNGVSVTKAPAGQSGGCPTGITPINLGSYDPIVPNYNDETSTSYEVGLKGNITRSVFFTLDAYYTITNGSLAAVNDGCAATNSCESGATQFTINGGKVHGNGIEAQLNSTWRLWGGNLSTTTDASIQKAEYVTGTTGQPLVGTPVAQNPHEIFDADLNYVHPISGNITGFANVSYHGQWGGIQDPITTANIYVHLADYQNLNLRTGFDYKNIEVAFIAQNLNNETHQDFTASQVGINTLTSQPTLVVTQTRLSLPRTYALEVKYKW